MSEKNISDIEGNESLENKEVVDEQAEENSIEESAPDAPISFDDTPKEENTEKNKKSRSVIRRVIWRLSLSLISLVLLLALTVFSAGAVIFHGPSTSIRDKFVNSLLEMSAAKWVPGVFLSKETIDEIVANNRILPTDEVTNPDLITPPTSNDTSNDDEWAAYPDGIQIHKIKADTYRGYVMIIRDPSKVYVATSSNFQNNAPGMKIMDVYEREGAIAAINGGDFPDYGGTGTGNVPLGLTVSNGKLLWGNLQTKYNNVVGFNEDNILVVGNMTGQEAINAKIRDCVSFTPGPILVINGEGATISGDSGSLNPRTAIGQRADGAVIFLCVDGRLPSSLGASYSDLVNIMIEFGAVNAANLDGGSSTHMIYRGEYINVSSSLYGPRTMPTFFMVKGE